MVAGVKKQLVALVFDFRIFDFVQFMAVDRDQEIAISQLQQKRIALFPCLEYRPFLEGRIVYSQKSFLDLTPWSGFG